MSQPTIPLIERCQLCGEIAYKDFTLDGRLITLCQSHAAYGLLGYQESSRTIGLLDAGETIDPVSDQRAWEIRNLEEELRQIALNPNLPIRMSRPIDYPVIPPNADIGAISEDEVRRGCQCFWCHREIEQHSGVQALMVPCDNGAPSYVCIEQFGAQDLIGLAQREFERLIEIRRGRS